MKTLQWYIDNAHHFIAIGQDEIRLYGKDAKPIIDELTPLAQTCERGGTFLWNVEVCVYLKYEHPCGLTFSWSEDLEFNGANELRPNSERLIWLRKTLPKSAGDGLTEAVEKLIRETEKQITESHESLDDRKRGLAALRAAMK